MRKNPLILVVDDETKIRRLVVSHLEGQGFDVMSAADGAIALTVFEKAQPRPDLVLLDVMMPDMDGFLCAQHLRRMANVPVIFLSARNEPSAKLRGFQFGADDYITKPFSLEELIARIQAVLRRSVRSGDAQNGIEMVVNGPMRLSPRTFEFWVDEKEVRLAEKEFRLLSILMKHQGVVLSHEQLVSAVWGHEEIGDVKHLRVAFTRIRRKLEEAGLEGGVISAYSGVGYVLRDLTLDPLST